MVSHPKQPNRQALMHEETLNPMQAQTLAHYLQPLRLPSTPHNSIPPELSAMTDGYNPSTLDLKLFHRLERDLYAHLVGTLGLNPERIKWVLSLWLWFESIGHYDFIRHVAAYSNNVILGFVNEGNACIDRLIASRRNEGTSAAGGGDEDELPLTTSLMAEPMDLRFFDYHSGVASKGVVHFFQNVSQIIFDDALMEAVARDKNQPANLQVLSSGLHYVRPFGEGTSNQAPILGSQQPLPLIGPLPPPPAVLARLMADRVVPSQMTPHPPPPHYFLNPMARPWSPLMEPRPDDQRSMFITFSRGYPISREDIMDFFNTRYGPCVEVVMIEKGEPGESPMYGRIVFKSVSTIAVVLNGQQTVKFMIKGKHLWARIYHPRSN